MPRWLQITVQSFIVAGATYIAYRTGGTQAAVVAAATGLSQLGIGAKAQSSNPDGTPATVAYVPKQ